MDSTRLAAPDPGAAEPRAHTRWRRLVRRSLTPLVAALLAMLASLLFVRTGQWSVFDEYTHFDYVVKVAQDLEIPAMSEDLGQTALQAAACEGAPGFESLYSSCGSVINPDDAPYEGLSTATNYLPTYYVITGLLTRGLAPVLVLVMPDRTAEFYWLTSARAVGSLYLGLLAAALVILARRLGAREPAAFAVAVIAATSPMMLLQFSTVNNDALGVLLSVGAVLTFVALDQNRAWVRWLAAYGVAALAISAKETALIALVAIMALQAAELWRSGRRAWALVAPVVISFGVVGGYQVIRTLRPIITGAMPGNDLQGEFIRSIQGSPTFIDVAAPTSASFVSGLSAPLGPLSWVGFTSWAVILASAAFGGAVARASNNSALEPPAGRTWAIASATSLFLIAFPFVFLGYLSLQGSPLYFQPRYLLPAMALAVGLLGGRSFEGRLVAVRHPCACLLRMCAVGHNRAGLTMKHQIAAILALAVQCTALTGCAMPSSLTPSLSPATEQPSLKARIAKSPSAGADAAAGLGYVDTAEATDDSLELTGWADWQSNEDPATLTVVVPAGFTGTVEESLRGARPDVSTTLGRRDLVAPGFSVTIAFEGPVPDTWCVIADGAGTTRHALSNSSSVLCPNVPGPG